jgi:hypothetical protein
MSLLSEQERNGLEDVFLSISKTRFSALRWSASHYHAYWTLHIRKSFLRFSNHFLGVKKNQKSAKLSILQKNYQKIEKHR